MNYTSLQDTANRLITAYGDLGMLTRYTTTYTASTGVSATTEDNYSIPMISKPMERSLTQDTVVQYGDTEALIPGDQAEPKIGDTIVYNSKNYKVLDVLIMAPADVVIAYKCHLRQVD